MALVKTLKWCIFTLLTSIYLWLVLQGLVLNTLIELLLTCLLPVLWLGTALWAAKASTSGWWLRFGAAWAIYSLITVVIAPEIAFIALFNLFWTLIVAAALGLFRVQAGSPRQQKREVYGRLAAAALGLLLALGLGEVLAGVMYQRLLVHQGVKRARDRVE